MFSDLATGKCIWDEYKGLRMYCTKFTGSRDTNALVTWKSVVFFPTIFKICFAHFLGNPLPKKKIIMFALCQNLTQTLFSYYPSIRVQDKELKPNSEI